eukprot:PITA_18256
MRVSLERELKLHVEDELLVLKEEEPQTDAKQPHAEDPRVETSTHVESSRDGWKCSREADKLILDARNNWDNHLLGTDKGEKQKARFFACGFSQVKGIDYDETFAPVERYSSIRSTLALSAKMSWKTLQMDVKTTFLNGKIEEEVYIEQPEGFETFDHESHVC